MGPLTVLSDLKRYVIAPVVQALDLPGDMIARIQITTGIGNVESGYRAKVQSGGGPAFGFWQMEPSTHDDIWLHYLTARPALAQVVRGYLPARFKSVAIGNARAMIESDAYAAAMTTILIRRSPVALPPRNDALAQCTVWKAAYNTALGAGAVDASRIALFQQAIDA
ncbi:hypothetical protein J2D73_12530 [Acetobacter sacchari]|uniref:Uncharacterized protein n=1 Tax=Acetobacter sacchari TaxID=2661687 RepID=A0ABS3LXI1_9PROT|nr:hypothetical protein [Acetobacter sacchari]MBO1360614.1 hypothetical protein [Acetobacter sacchari]